MKTNYKKLRLQALATYVSIKNALYCSEYDSKQGKRLSRLQYQALERLNRRQLSEFRYG